MASRDVEIRLVAKDGTTEVFRKVADSADKMGRSIDEAGKKSARSMTEAKQAGKDLAIGVGALAGAFALAARSQVAAERQSALLTRQYGDQAVVLRELSEEIQRTTEFSNDQAVQAINLFATLQRNYGLTADQIEQLTHVTVDLAAATGIDLADAALRVQSAIRGEAEAAELLGLTMNQQSIDRENLTLTMSNQEAAQFRLNALLEQSAFAEGAAAERAATAAGSFQQMANRVQDAAQAVAAWSGVTGEAVAVASDFTLQLALMGAGVVKLGSGIGRLAGAAGIASLVPLLGGPVGIGIAGAAIAAGAAFLLLRDRADEFAVSADLAEIHTRDLETALKDLAAAGSGRALVAEGLTQQFGVMGDEVARLTADVDTLAAELADTDEALRNALQLNRTAENAAVLDTRIINLTATLGGLRAELAEAEDLTASYAAAQVALAEILTHQGPGYEAAIANVEVLMQAQRDGTLTLDQLFDAIIGTAESLTRYDLRAIDAAESTQTLGDNAATATSHQAGLNDAIAESNTILGDFVGWVRRAGAATAAAAEDVGTADRIAAFLGLPVDWERRADEAIRRVRDAATAPAPEMEASAAVAHILSDQEVAYLNLTTGILRASEAQVVFKMTQDDLIASQSVYSQQQSEYQGQLNALQAAEDVLNQRRADGLVLTAEQEDFLIRVNAAQGRLTGGVEDAIVAEGMLALQYAENVRVGDQLNENMRGQQEITGQLVEIVKNLILALDGVPEEVKSDIRLIGAETAIDQANRVAGALFGIPQNLQSHILVTQSFGPAVGPGGLFPIGLGTGGTVHGDLALPRGAATGITVGEFGPEFIPNPPTGLQVMPHGAAMSRLASEGRRGRREGGVIFRGPVTFNVDTPDHYDVWRQQAVGGARR